MSAITEQLIKEYRKKSYRDLLALPEHFHLNVPELKNLNQSIEFIRCKLDDNSLKIVFKHVYWDTPAEAKERYISQLMLIKDISRADAGKQAEKILKKGLVPGQSKSDLADIIKENPEAAYPTIPMGELIFNNASFESFIKYTDNSSMTALEEISRLMEIENNIQEEADWFGQTGLGEDIERELPFYLRLEFSESLNDEDSLKASDLVYLGNFCLTEADYRNEKTCFYEDENIESVYIWEIENSKEYGYIMVYHDGGYGMSMGDFLPEQAKI